MGYRQNKQHHHRHEHHHYYHKERESYGTYSEPHWLEYVIAAILVGGWCWFWIKVFVALFY